MNIAPLGELVPEEDLPEWLKSEPFPVPFFEGLELPFVFQDIEEDAAPADFESALKAFLALGPAERGQAGEYVFKVYQRFVDIVGEEEFEFTIPDASTVWDFVTPSIIYLSRRQYDGRIYVQIDAECEWEIEHGLTVVYKEGTTLARVSDQDGHLTTSDAFGWPEEKNTIIYEED
jgi:hypothetical protein